MYVRDRVAHRPVFPYPTRRKLFPTKSRGSLINKYLDPTRPAVNSQITTQKLYLLKNQTRPESPDPPIFVRKTDLTRFDPRVDSTGAQLSCDTITGKTVSSKTHFPKKTSRLNRRAVERSKTISYQRDDLEEARVDFKYVQPVRL